MVAESDGCEKKLMTSISFYPILKAPGCRGWATLCNFAPNNWERTGSSEKFVNVTWASGGEWRTENLGTLAAGAMRSVRMDDVAGVIAGGALPLLSLTQAKLPARSATLPALDVPGTTAPAWRATLGLATATASTSYQGEVDPFPPSGSMLTFCPFLQFGHFVENYLIFLNIEREPAERTAEVEIYDSDRGRLKGVAHVRNNDATVISLDGLGLTPDDLPTIVCRKMAGVPLYFSKTADGAFLSLEHTHPPASYVIHGKRWEVQKILKHFWFSKVAR
jgi:hypothetical protein